MVDDNDKQSPVCVHMPLAILPGNPPEICPELLTTEEAIKYLRLDCNCQTRGDLAVAR